MNQGKVDKLLVKLVENRLPEKESEELLVWLKSKENQDYLNEFVKINHLLNSQQNFKKSNELLEHIMSPMSRFRYAPLLKYAAIVFVLVTTFFFFKSGLLSINSNPPAPIVKNNNIHPGVNAAILTLGDGSDVNLGEGEEFVTTSLNAKGSQVVYSSMGGTKELEYNYITVPRGGQFALQLSDSSKIWLNSESKLKYPVNFIKGQSREVYLLYGEAYFEVASSTRNNGDDFKVYYEEQEVQVLGTQFNIKAYRNEPEVLTTLVEGEVVVGNGEKSLKLTPGEQSRLNLDTGTIKISEVDVFSETSWKSGVFSFRKKRLEDIMRTLSRWYDMDVVFKDESLKDKKFKGVLRKNQSIEEVLSIIMSNSLHSYEINNKTVIIE